MAEKTLTTADINKAISRRSRESRVIRIGGLSGQDAVAVGIDKDLELQVIGEAGDFFCALNDLAVITLEGSAGNYAGDNMTGGGLIINGNAGKGAGANLRQGIIVIKGKAGNALGIGNRSGTIIVQNDAGNDTGLLQCDGNIIVCGNVKKRLGHLMTGGAIFLGGTAESLGENVKVLSLNDVDKKRLKIYFEHYGIDRDPGTFKKIMARDANALSVLAPGMNKRSEKDSMSKIKIPPAVLYSPASMDFDFGHGADAMAVNIGKGRVKEFLSLPVPLIMDTPFDGIVHAGIKEQFARLSAKVGIPYIRGTGVYTAGESVEADKGAKLISCWTPGREGMSVEILRASSGVIVDICSGIDTALGAAYYTLESKGENDANPSRSKWLVPHRHLDMESIKDLKTHLLLIREITGYRIPVIIRMEGGHLYQDLKLALKVGADSVILRESGVFRKIDEGKESAYPVLGMFPVIQKVKRELGLKDDITIGIEMNCRGSDLAKSIALGADYMVLPTHNLIGCRECVNCNSGKICEGISHIVTGSNTGHGKITLDAIEKRIEILENDLKTVLVSQSLSSVRKLSPRLLYASDYDTAAMTGIKLAGYGKKLPMWSH